MGKQRLLNIYVDNLNMEEAVRKIDRLIYEKRKSYVVPVNVDVIVKSESDGDLKQIIDCADIVLVDGQPLVWISKWHNTPVKEKVSGSDLVPELCGLAAKKGYSVFILGGKNGVAEIAKSNIEHRYPDIKVTQVYEPPLGFERDKKELDKIYDIISQKHPDILFVCLGCPKQEKWVYNNYKRCGATVSVCAGATVDFLAGNIRRAPKWMSNHGLEWIYRLIKEPRRLCGRYFNDIVKILPMLWKYRKKI